MWLLWKLMDAYWLAHSRALARFSTWNFWLSVCVLAVVPCLMAVYSANVTAESVPDPRHRRNVRMIFWAFGALWILVAFGYQFGVAGSEEQTAEKQHETQEWERGVNQKLDQIIGRPTSSVTQRKQAISLKHEVKIKRTSVADQVASEDRPGIANALVDAADILFWAEVARDKARDRAYRVFNRLTFAGRKTATPDELAQYVRDLNKQLTKADGDFYDRTVPAASKLVSNFEKIRKLLNKPERGPDFDKWESTFRAIALRERRDFDPSGAKKYLDSLAAQIA